MSTDDENAIRLIELAVVLNTDRITDAATHLNVSATCRLVAARRAQQAWYKAPNAWAYDCTGEYDADASLLGIRINTINLIKAENGIMPVDEKARIRTEAIHALGYAAIHNTTSISEAIDRTSGSPSAYRLALLALRQAAQSAGNACDTESAGVRTAAMNLLTEGWNP